LIRIPNQTNIYEEEKYEYGDYGFDVIVINFRGLAGAKLKTP
jgi:hypothetical protein